jgi:Ca-activated chloride channel homolog
MIEQFHFLRPGWLLALLLLALALWLLRRHGYDSGNWRAVIDPRLLPHVLSATASARARRMPWIIAAAVALAIVALAGPTWEKRQQAVYQQQSALVIALDLSRSMDATDIRPSRLARARHKIADILKLRLEGQSALLVYAADAFTVTPLTSDVETILALLPVLETRLMPSQGTRADRAFERALELITNSGLAQGDLLLVTDGVSELEAERLETLLEQHGGLRLSVLAIGTPEGGPVPLSSGDFLKNRDGDIVIAKMNAAALQGLAQRGGGAYTALSADDLDINTLNYVMEARIDRGQSQQSDRSADLWRELGPSLLLLVLPLAALAFRRGLLWLAPIFLLAAPPDADALDWQALWQNDDQRALQLYREGQHRQAAELFDNEDWQASASYRAGDYAAAAENWQRLDGVEAAYNHATALAQQGRYEEALAAYDRLLEQQPGYEDALFNRQAIEEWLKQQPPQQNAAQQDGQQDGQQGGQQDGQQDGQQQEQQSGDASEGQQQSRQDGAGDGAEGNPQQESAGADEQPWEQNRQGGQSSAQEQAQNDSGSDEEREQQAASATQQAEAQQAQGDDVQGQAEEQTSLDQQMSEQAAQQWLRKIPDDPGGLLRRKFRYQYRQRGAAVTEEQAW